MLNKEGFLRDHGDKIVTPEAAARLVQHGQHVFVGTACATPRTLVAALEALERPPATSSSPTS